MKREIVELVEATRNLKIQRCPTENNNHSIKLHGNKEDFPNRLYEVALALENVDRMDAQGLNEQDDPTLDAAKLRTAIDHLFRWMRSHGIDVNEPYEVVAAALGSPGTKPKKSPKPAPRFGSGPFKQGDIKSNPFKLEPPAGEKITLGELRRRAYKQQSIENSMGAASAKVV